MVGGVVKFYDDEWHAGRLQSRSDGPSSSAVARYDNMILLRFFWRFDGARVREGRAGREVESGEAAAPPAAERYGGS